MKQKLRKSYVFALKASVYITIVTTLVLILFFYFVEVKIWYVLPLAIFFFVLNFVVVQYRIQSVIYKGIDTIYNEVSLSSKKVEPIVTDISTLKKEITRFAQDKEDEINILKIREDYRKEFIGNVSHELNTPLFTVQGYILTLLDGAMEDKTIRKKYLQRAAKSVERLVYIVKDLEMISKLESGELLLDRTTFDIVEIIQFSFELLEIKAKKKNITLLFDKNYTPIYVNADRERIQQVIGNILMNSIKYGRENGTTEVAIESFSNDKIIIKITDNGEGVSQENIHRLFERFFRVDKTGNRKQGGSGLGLSIVKYIIEAHHEHIYVESTIDVGSEFSFTLPKASGM